MDKTKDVLVEFYAPCKYILITVTVNSFTSILVGKKSFNPFTPEPPITARVDPLVQTSSVLTVKDNFVNLLLQGDEIFKFLPE